MKREWVGAKVDRKNEDTEIRSLKPERRHCYVIVGLYILTIVMLIMMVMMSMACLAVIGPKYFSKNYILRKDKKIAS